MMITRLIGLLIVLILGSIAAQELYKAVTPLIPLLSVLVVIGVFLGGWLWYRGRF